MFLGVHDRNITPFSTAAVSPKLSTGIAVAGSSSMIF